MSNQEQIVREYDNGEVTVVWKPALCIHASYCWKELPEVFDPKKKPWVNINGAPTQRIIKQVERCPSGALSYYMTKEKNKSQQNGDEEVTVKVKIHQGGPMVIDDCVEVEKGDGTKERVCGVAFCRCGHSKNQPYCDSTHLSIGFDK